MTEVAIPPASRASEKKVCLIIRKNFFEPTLHLLMDYLWESFGQVTSGLRSIMATCCYFSIRSQNYLTQQKSITRDKNFISTFDTEACESTDICVTDIAKLSSSCFPGCFFMSLCLPVTGNKKTHFSLAKCTSFF